MKIKTLIVVLFAIVLAGCDQEHESENESEHENESIEEVKFQYTAYSSKYEVFAEADAFIIGKMSNILSHFSTLPEFRAVESSEISLILNINGKETKQSLKKPTRKGIYSFNIKPEVAGKGFLKYEITNEHGFFEVLVPDVIVFSTHENAQLESEKNTISKTNTTVFTKEQSWKIDFSTNYPEKESFGQIIKATALLKSAPSDEIIVTAKTNGIVMLNDNNLLEGFEVKNDQALFTISGNDLADNNFLIKHSEAKNNFEKTKTDYERSKELAKDKIVSAKDLLKTKNDFENAKVIYNNLNKNFNSLGHSVKSPKTGFIKQVFVENGSYVEAGEPMLTISQNKTLILSADVQQKYAQVLRSIVSANIRTLYDNKTYSLKELNGKILSFGKSTNENNFLIPVNLQIENPDNLTPGSFVEIILKTSTSKQALTIPNSAIIEEQGNYFTYVQVTPELFEKIRIKTGKTDGIKTEIENGLSINNRIVTNGAILIKLAQATGALDAQSGHNH